MLRGLYTSTTGMLAEQARENVIANNLANVDSRGFKRDVVTFDEFARLLVSRIKESPQGISKSGPVGVIGMGVTPRGVRPIFEDGPVVPTGAPLDLAIAGDGFFVVETPEGEAYTRNGAFTLDPEGYLVTEGGYRVLGESGPIRLTPGEVHVAEDGSIFSLTDAGNPAELSAGRLRIITFPNLAGLRKRGDSLFLATQVAGVPMRANGRVKQGYLENSNVEPVLEMVRMIECLRAYETNQKAIAFQDETLEKVINEVGRA